MVGLLGESVVITADLGGSIVTQTVTVGAGVEMTAFSNRASIDVSDLGVSINWTGSINTGTSLRVTVSDIADESIGAVTSISSTWSANFGSGVLNPESTSFSTDSITGGIRFSGFQTGINATQNISFTAVDNSVSLITFDTLTSPYPTNDFTRTESGINYTVDFARGFNSSTFEGPFFYTSGADVIASYYADGRTSDITAISLNNVEAILESFAFDTLGDTYTVRGYLNEVQVFSQTHNGSSFIPATGGQVIDEIQITGGHPTLGQYFDINTLLFSGVNTDSTAPTVTSITRLNPTDASTDADAVTFRVQFDERVKNVNAADFSLTGTLAGTSSITGVSKVGRNDTLFNVSVNVPDDGGGTIGLGFSGSQNIQDFASIALSNTTPTGANETYTITGLNTAPTANDDGYSTNEDVTLVVAASGVLANDVDLESDPLTAILVSDVSNGTLTLNSGGDFTYVPDANFNGSDSFTYKANDGLEDSGTATVTITVNPVNDPPVAVDDSGTTDEDTAVVLGVVANDSDLENDTLSVSAVSTASNGTVANNNDGTVTYTPNADFNGSDSFTYTLSDGNGGSDTATVNVTVNAVNDLPVALDDGYSTDEDTTLIVSASGVLANDTDVENDPLSAILVNDVSNGTLTLNGDGSLSYDPDLNFNGTDSFTYMANDGTGDSTEATVTITVNPVNDLPVGVDDGYTTDEDTTLVVAASGVLGNDIDVDGDALTAVLVNDVSNGTLTLNSDGSLSYDPDLNFNGTDSFTYKASDGTGDSGDTTVLITVNPVNDDPVAVDDAFTVFEDAVSLDLTALLLSNDSDIENDSLVIFSVDTTGTLGTVDFSANAQTLTFAADDDALDALAPGESQVTSFDYTISDGQGGFDTATVNVTVDGVDEPDSKGKLNGGGGDNALIGDDGDNLIRGGGGNDLLNGGAGDDDMNAGAGLDTFVFGPNSGQDTVKGFVSGEDVLDARGALGVLTHAEVFAFFDTNGDDLVNSADDHSYLVRNKLVLEFDGDGIDQNGPDSVLIHSVQALLATDFDNLFTA